MFLPHIPRLLVTLHPHSLATRIWAADLPSGLKEYSGEESRDREESGEESGEEDPGEEDGEGSVPYPLSDDVESVECVHSLYDSICIIISTMQ